MAKSAQPLKKSRAGHCLARRSHAFSVTKTGARRSEVGAVADPTFDSTRRIAFGHADFSGMTCKNISVFSKFIFTSAATSVFSSFNNIEWQPAFKSSELRRIKS